MSGELTYLAFELGWALPVVIGQWVVGGRTLWSRRAAIAPVVGLLTIYLCAADRFAIGNQIWTISPERVTGVALLGLPIEEVIFFLCTNLMVIQALVLLENRETRTRALVERILTSTRRLEIPSGYHRGVRLALLGAVLSGVNAVIFGTPSGLEPFAETVIGLTPLPVATTLLAVPHLPTEIPRALATLGGLAFYLLFGGVVGVLLALRRWPLRLAALILVLGLAWLAHGASLPAFLVDSSTWPAPVVLFFPLLLAILERPGSNRAWPIVNAEIGNPHRLSRRAVLDRLVVMGGAGLVTALQVADDRRSAAVDEAVAARVASRVAMPGFDFARLTTDSWGLNGLTPVLTSTNTFYRVSKNADDPRLSLARWSLTIGGEVALPRRLSLDDLLSLPLTRRAVTLECVDNPLGGPLASTAIWAGTRVVDLVTRAQPLPSATRMVVIGADGLDEDIPLARLAEIDPLLAFAMNAELLSRAHGFPLRLIVPGYYGFKNTKWVTRIELVGDGVGYWSRRGWDALPPIAATARIDVARRVAPGTRAEILVAGVALAGRRGVARVEVRGDSGTWVGAELRAPPLSDATWVQWRGWLPDDGSREAVARVVDLAGQNVVEGPTSAFPAGSRGWTHRSVDG